MERIDVSEYPYFVKMRNKISFPDGIEMERINPYKTNFVTGMKLIPLHGYKKYKIFKFQENNGYLELLVGTISYDNVLEKFEGVSNSKIIYSIKDKTASYIEDEKVIDIKSNSSIIDKVFETHEETFLDEKSLIDIRKFANEMILNEVWKGCYYELISLLSENAILGDKDLEVEIHYPTIIKLFTLGLADLIEKLCKSNMKKTALSLICGKEDIDKLSYSSKLKGCLNISKYAMEFLKITETVTGKSYMNFVRKMLETYGDKGDQFFVFLNSYFNFFKFNRNNKSLMARIIENIEIFADNSVDVEKSINYLVKTLFNYGFISEGKETLKELLHTYNDYVNMMNQMEIRDFNLYPEDIIHAHNVASNQVTIYEKEKEFKNNKSTFKEAVDSYRHLEYKDESSDYVVIVPTELRELIEEGQKLSHCVASYIQNIIRGTSKILFVRKKEEQNNPYMTLEVRDNKLVQAKKLANSYPCKEDEKFLIQWTKDKKIRIGGY